MTRHPPPACDLATLLPEPCRGGCERQLHRGTPLNYGTNAACSGGHPKHVGRGLCAGCRHRIRRAGDLDVYPPLREDDDGLALALRLGSRRRAHDPRWYRAAACAGARLERFVPSQASRATVHVARATALAYCARCPVLAACAADADAGREVGLWGGSFRTGGPYRYRWRQLLTAAPAPTVGQPVDHDAELAS